MDYSHSLSTTGAVCVSAHCRSHIDVCMNIICIKACVQEQNTNKSLTDASVFATFFFQVSHSGLSLTIRLVFPPLSDFSPPFC